VHWWCTYCHGLTLFAIMLRTVWIIFTKRLTPFAMMLRSVSLPWRCLSPLLACHRQCPSPLLALLVLLFSCLVVAPHCLLLLLSVPLMVPPSSFVVAMLVFPLLVPLPGHATTSWYPPITPPTGSGGGLSCPLPGSAPSLHERSGAGSVQWMCTSKGPYLGGIPKTFQTLSLTLAWLIGTSDDFDAFFVSTMALSLNWWLQVTIVVFFLLWISLHPMWIFLVPPSLPAAAMPLDGDHSSLEWAQSTYWAG
jgi:hypothetical protein